MTKVCVIGAGTSGLAVAWELAKAGHHPIVLGGHTAIGGEVSAISPLVHDIDTGRSCVLAGYSPDRAYARLRSELFPSIGAPGLAHSARQLATPVGTWLREHGLEAMAGTVGLRYTATGFGYLMSLPALYFVKYAETTHTTVDWRRVAATLPDVRHVDIQAIDRGDHVRVSTSQGVVDADALVITAPLHDLLPVMDATAHEVDLAHRVRYLSLQTAVFSADGLPAHPLLLRHHNGTPPGHGHLMYLRQLSEGLFAGLSYGLPGTSTADATELLAGDLAQLGGQLDELHRRDVRLVMPHFTSTDLAGGVYDWLEAMQGANATYHAGGLPAFELTDCAVTHAQALVRGIFQRNFSLAA